MVDNLLHKVALTLQPSLDDLSSIACSSGLCLTHFQGFFFYALSGNHVPDVPWFGIEVLPLRGYFRPHPTRGSCTKDRMHLLGDYLDS